MCRWSHVLLILYFTRFRLHTYRSQPIRHNIQLIIHHMYTLLNTCAPKCNHARPIRRHTCTAYKTHVQPIRKTPRYIFHHTDITQTSHDIICAEVYAQRSGTNAPETNSTNSYFSRQPERHACSQILQLHVLQARSASTKWSPNRALRIMCSLHLVPQWRTIKSMLFGRTICKTISVHCKPSRR